MKLCFVIQRYGIEVAGGAELHCRWLAERLAARHDVQVLTTCALDYIEWRNHYPAGRAEVEGIPVSRFPVTHPRSEQRFARLSRIVFAEEHNLAEERRWVEENGPWSPALIQAVARLSDVDFFVFYSYRYCPTFFGIPRVASRAILVPTAEEDPAVRLPIFRDLFRSPRGILYLTPEEHDLIVAVSGNDMVPSTVIGSGIDIPRGWDEVNVEQRFGLSGDYVLYVGRIDRNKGVDSLFQYYLWLTSEWPEAPPLILVGNPILPIPESPKIRHLGFLKDEEKYALISRCTLLLMPSRYESLAIVVLEAWAMGRPVLANGACRVLEGQCRRSGGGLLYRDYAEFRIALRLLVGRPDLRSSLGESGRKYVHRESDWNVVEQRTNDFLEELSCQNRSERPARESANVSTSTSPLE